MPFGRKLQKADEKTAKTVVEAVLSILSKNPALRIRWDDKITSMSSFSNILCTEMGITCDNTNQGFIRKLRKNYNIDEMINDPQVQIRKINDPQVQIRNLQQRQPLPAPIATPPAQSFVERCLEYIRNPNNKDKTVKSSKNCDNCPLTIEHLLESLDFNKGINMDHVELCISLLSCKNNVLTNRLRYAEHRYGKIISEVSDHEIDSYKFVIWPLVSHIGTDSHLGVAIVDVPARTIKYYEPNPNFRSISTDFIINFMPFVRNYAQRNTKNKIKKQNEYDYTIEIVQDIACNNGPNCAVLTLIYIEYILQEKPIPNDPFTIQSLNDKRKQFLCEIIDPTSLDK